MIKGNESDVGNIGFSYSLKEVTILIFYIVFELQIMFISLQPDVRLRWVWI